MGLRDDFIAARPDFPLLSGADLDLVAELMERLGWLELGERLVAVERAGDGNMNLTLRVDTDRRSLILKQSRPWVEKYDTIPAPFDRAVTEARFYQRTAELDGVSSAMPSLLGFDAATRTLLLEDLGSAQDLSLLYAHGRLAVDELRALSRYLKCLHDGTRGESPRGLENRAMRALNHQHIFVVPMTPGAGPELEPFEPGLATTATRICGNEALRAALSELGGRYLADGDCLVHGDYFPGSWLRTEQGVRVIDPEFAFFGDAELDYGVAVAHLALARQEAGLSRMLVGSGATAEQPLDVGLVAAYAGAEVIRRLIGVAQLPIEPSGGFRTALLDRATEAVVGRSLEALFA